MSHTLKGIAASPGIAIAKVYRLAVSAYVPVRSVVPDSEQEATRFREAVEQAKQELEALRELTEARLGAQKAEIFEAHALVLEDPDFIDIIHERIVQKNICAEYALHEVSQSFIEMLNEMDNELLRERAADVRDVSGRVMSHLRGETYTTVSGISEESIIVAEDLSPSDTAQLNLDYVRGFITEVGSRTSHSAIMARSLGTPAIVGVGAAAREIEAGVTVIMDATEGRITVNPSEHELQAYRQKKEQYEGRRLELAKLKDQSTLSKDGHHVELAANIGSVEDLQKVLENGAEGIGLFRTEFLYMGRTSFPTEEEQFNVYKHVLEKMEGKPVVIRTMDIGGDKELPYLKLPVESNPFLGLRAIRLSLQRQDLFRTQLRALLRASEYGRLKIMFPMIAVQEELSEAKRVLREEQDKLIQEGVPLAANIEVGIMVEVPAAALAADSLAKEVDFFSIGTNDLIQYTMAADRMNETVSYLYQPCHPSILRLIQMVISAAEQEGKWVGMCGEMAGDEAAIPLLLGLGLYEFSMSASSILPARALIARLSRTEWKEHASRALAFRSQDEIKTYVEQQIKE